MSENTKIHEDRDLSSKAYQEKHLRNMALRRLMSSSAVVQDDLLEVMTEKACAPNCGHDHHDHHHYEDEE